MFELKAARKIASTLEGNLVSAQNHTHIINYNHVGATVCDSILQAGLNYNNVVKPRIRNILVLYANYETTSSFLDLINRFGLDNIIKWQNEVKIKRIKALLTLFKTENLETEVNIKHWLFNKESEAKLLQINGIGPKTVDYLKKLIGINSIPIDRHLIHFAKEIGLMETDYQYLQKVFKYAADLMSIEHSTFDSMVWSFLSQKK